MNPYDTAHHLAREIQQTDAYRNYHALKELVEESETNRVLLKEYKRLQMSLQLRFAGGGEQEGEDVQRFSQLSALLMSNEEISQFLLAEMQLQKLLADLMKILTDATGISFDLPGA